jgi:hypothetical protein
MNPRFVLIYFLMLLLCPNFSFSQSIQSNELTKQWESCGITVKKSQKNIFKREWTESCYPVEVKKWDENKINFVIFYEKKGKKEFFIWDINKKYGYSYFKGKPDNKLPFYLTKISDEFWKGWSEDPYGRVYDICLITRKLKQSGKTLMSDFLNQDKWYLSMLGGNGKIDEYHPVKVVLDDSNKLIFNSFHKTTYERTSYVMDKNKSLGHWVTASGIFTLKSKSDQFMLKEIDSNYWKGWYKKPGDASHYGIKLIPEKILLDEIQKEETITQQKRVARKQERVARKQERVARKQERVARKQERAIESTFHCPETQAEGLTKNEAKALKYLIGKKYIQGKNICVEKITANDKFTLKQNTIVKYSAILFFPKGYKTECLNFKASDLDNNFTWSGWNKLSQGCNDYDNQLDTLGGPLKPGGRKTIEGDEEI